MKIQKTGTVCEVAIEGAVGEVSPLFGIDSRGLTKLVLDGQKMTYMNSIGVKNWILWTSRIEKTCEFILKNMPLMMISQASQVLGFMPAHGNIESFHAPYTCDACGTETMVTLTRGNHYQYAQPPVAKQVKLPQVTCPKCRAEMTPDFIEAKVFPFLDRK